MSGAREGTTTADVPACSAGEEGTAAPNRDLGEAEVSLNLLICLCPGQISISSSLDSRSPSVIPGSVVCTTALLLGELPAFGFGPPIRAIQDPPGEALRVVLPLASWAGVGDPLLPWRPSRARALMIITLN